jgi:hypothetical protein
MLPVSGLLLMKNHVAKRKQELKILFHLSFIFAGEAGKATQTAKLQIINAFREKTIAYYPSVSRAQTNKNTIYNFIVQNIVKNIC